MQPPKRSRRTPQQRIAELEEQIAKIKAQAEQERIAEDPVLGPIVRALQCIAQAMSAAQEMGTQRALRTAGRTLKSCLEARGFEVTEPELIVVPKRKQRPREREGAILRYLTEHPESPNSEIAAALDTHPVVLRPALHRLERAGRIRIEGKGPGTRYFLVEGEEGSPPARPAQGEGPRARLASSLSCSRGG